MNKNLIKQVEQEILNNYPRAIRLVPVSGTKADALKRKQTDSFEQFVTKFFTTYNRLFNTIYVDDKEVDTVTEKRRSIGDIYMICKYYYPEVTLERLLAFLYTVLPEELAGFRSSYCGTILKRVWYYDSSKKSSIYNKQTPDEYGNTVHSYMGEDFDPEF